MGIIVPLSAFTSCFMMSVQNAVRREVKIGPLRSLEEIQLKKEIHLETALSQFQDSASSSDRYLLHLLKTQHIYANITSNRELYF